LESMPARSASGRKGVLGFVRSRFWPYTLFGSVPPVRNKKRPFAPKETGILQKTLDPPELNSALSSVGMSLTRLKTIAPGKDSRQEGGVEALDSNGCRGSRKKQEIIVVNRENKKRGEKFPSGRKGKIQRKSKLPVPVEFRTEKKQFRKGKRAGIIRGGKNLTRKRTPMLLSWGGIDLPGHAKRSKKTNRLLLPRGKREGNHQ